MIEREGNVAVDTLTDNNFEMRELYRLYCQYMNAAARKQGRQFVPHDFDRFCHVWKDMPQAVREKCRADFGKGFERVLDEVGSQLGISQLRD